MSVTKRLVKQENSERGSFVVSARKRSICHRGLFRELKPQTLSAPSVENPQAPTVQVLLNSESLATNRVGKKGGGVNRGDGLFLFSDGLEIFGVNRFLRDVNCLGVDRETGMVGFGTGIFVVHVSDEI